MRFLITGGTGFVGKTLIPFLYDNGVTDITLLVRDKEKAQRLFPYNLNCISTENSDWNKEVIAFSPDIVLHMATRFTGKCDAESAREIISTNVLFTTLLLEALTHTTCKHFINVGTFTEFLYGDGHYFANNLYSASKTAVRPIIRFYQTISEWKWTNIVLYSPYGRKNENKKVIDFLINAIDSEKAVPFSGGEQILDFIHVDDIAQFFLTLFTLMNKDEWNRDYTELHLGTGKGYSIREVAGIIEKVTGKKINACWGALPYRKFDPMHAVAPIEKNIELLNWRSQISMEEGIKILLSDK